LVGGDLLLKLVSFDVWDTLLSVNAFYANLSEELSRITSRQKIALEKKLLEGYEELRAIRRSGGFEESKIVPMALEAISKILEVDTETMRKAVTRTVAESSPERYVIDGAKETLATIKSSGFKVIITGNVVFWPGSYNRILLEKAGLTEFIDSQFYADEIGVSKPKQDIFLKALSEFNVKPQEALHIGNSLFEDFVGAILAGMNAVLIDTSVDNPLKLSSGRAYIVPTIGSLKGIITELLS
jgi:putative hydrolase of the HAD superfamily